MKRVKHQNKPLAAVLPSEGMLWMYSVFTIHYEFNFCLFQSAYDNEEDKTFFDEDSIHYRIWVSDFVTDHSSDDGEDTSTFLMNSRLWHKQKRCLKSE